MGILQNTGDPTHGLFRLPDADERSRLRAGAPLNPIKIMMMLSTIEWLWFLGGLLTWIMDSYDFFSVSLSVTPLQDLYHKEATDITYAILLTLLFRSLGALLFGVAADRFGRRWTLTVNMLFVAALSLGTAYCDTFPKFLGVRCIFGVAMGGVWGLSTATALENMTPAARGLFSGILQQGYAMGYLIAAAVNLGWANPSNDWRILFFLGAGLSLLGAIVRAILPESPKFLEQKRQRKQKTSNENGVKTFCRDFGNMLKRYWPQCIYAILLMTGFNFFSHSSQDLYPKMLEASKGLTSGQASTATIISNCGAISGGIIAGYVSQYTGRRIAMLTFVVLAGVLIPAWILPNSFSGLAAGGFFIQFGVQGAWGVIPAYLSEISPAAFRATFPGLAYQLGNMASSASSTIESRGGDNIKMKDPKNPGKMIPDYATVSAILMGCVAGYLVILIVFGIERGGGELKVNDSDPDGLTADFRGGPGRDIESPATQPNADNAYIHDPQQFEHVADAKLCDPNIDEKKIGA
ncbi:hypothetical protein MSPP1_003119 [Malassezia sp. CBS 17886]|nr:hypothetical protein MSPP1_003119 [Malassezia sp. CBS 17886]